MSFRDAFFQSAAWTGVKNSGEASPTKMTTGASIEEVGTAPINPTPTEAKPYVPLRYDEVKAEVPTFDHAALKEYAEVAAIVGVRPPDMVVEEFKLFLVASGMTVFALETVIDFMDRKSKAEGYGWGWNWLPLRDKDRILRSFGTPAQRRQLDPFGVLGRMSDTPQWIGEDRPASDFYTPHNSAGPGMVSPVDTYPHTVPLHALKKVAQIEADFPHPVAFMVSDYAPAPQFRVDPFLMAVVNNPKLAAGVGRFVIDVWDEPGFGIVQMLKSDLLAAE